MRMKEAFMKNRVLFSLLGAAALFSLYYFLHHWGLVHSLIEGILYGGTAYIGAGLLKKQNTPQAS